MAQSGYTPIILFNSGTTGHAPTTANLTLGELAINYTDGNIFYNNGVGSIVSFTPSVLAATSGTINGVSIGQTTAAAGRFTNLTATGTLTVSSTVSGTGIINLFASPYALGGSTPNSGSFTALTSNSLVINPSSPSMTELQIGSGATSLAGLYLGNDISGYGAIWPTVVAPTTTNYALAAGAVTYLNNLSSVVINVANLPIVSVSADTATIKGTILGGNAAAGQVGEYLTATNSGVALTIGVSTNITSISLTAGDWDVWGSVGCNGASGSWSLYGWISTISASLPTFPQMAISFNSAAGVQQVTPPMLRVNVSSTTTVYLSAQAQVTTTNGAGFISARRRR